MGASKTKVAPDPQAAGWQAGDPAPVMGTAETRHRSATAARVQKNPHEAVTSPLDSNVDRALLQRLTAIEKANAVRLGRVKIKRRVECGDLLVSELLANPPPLVRTVAVARILTWVPFVGKARAKKILGPVMNSQTLTPQDLGPCTRAAVIARLQKLGF